MPTVVKLLKKHSRKQKSISKALHIIRGVSLDHVDNLKNFDVTENIKTSQQQRKSKNPFFNTKVLTIYLLLQFNFAHVAFMWFTTILQLKMNETHEYKVAPISFISSQTYCDICRELSILYRTNSKYGQHRTSISNSSEQTEQQNFSKVPKILPTNSQNKSRYRYIVSFVTCKHICLMRTKFFI